MTTRSPLLGCLLLVACASGPPAAGPTPELAAACLERWQAYQGGGTPGDALTACRSACAAGDGEGCRLEAAFLRSGVGTARDTAAAARTAERGCTLGSFRACGDLANHLASGEGVRADPARALTLADKSCADGYEIACHNLGVALETGKTGGKSPIDLPRAYAAYSRACDLGQADACHRAGLFAEQGRGVPQADLVASLNWYAKAWHKGHREGCLAAARRVLAGRARFGAEPDAWDAKLFGAACKHGDQAACVELGWRTWIGRGLDPDEQRAAALAAAACPTTPAGCALAGLLRGEQAGAHAFLNPRCVGGDRVACEELAIVLARGRPEDRAWAAGVAREACGRGVADMCGLEAELMQADRPVDALALFEKGCAAGHPESCHGAGVLLETDPGKAITMAGRTREVALREAVERFIDGCRLDDDRSCAAASRLVRDGWDRADGDELATWRVQLFEHTCARGDATACGAFALELYRGRGVPVDHGRAAELGAKACDGGDSVGCLVAGVYWWGKRADGLGDEPLKTAIPLLDRGCERGHSEACAWAGVALTSCSAAPCDPARGKPLLERACKDGVDFACEHAAEVKERQAHEKRAEKATRACEQGDGRACLQAGDLWGKVDFAEPRREPMYERGCELKVGAACRQRGYLIFGLHDAARDARRPWFQRACELGDGAGCGALVYLVPMAERSALQERACSLRHGPSCGALGSAALHGWGAQPADPARGERLLRKACDLGSSDDCGTLAYAYRTGSGLRKSPALAKKYQDRRCALRGSLACDKPGRP
ncbi:MAG: sel1 repeat family protein [Deltaproteobacteria bacterium]|nr:sel1 repeat family protein [Deltaproteobacteria bacterium]